MKLKKFGGTEKSVYDMVLPIAEELGFKIWDVSFEKEGAYWYLRVFIDHENGITIDDCETMTRPVNQILERVLCQSWHFEDSIGKMVKAHSIRPIDGEKEWIGILTDFDGENISVKLESESIVQLALSELSYIKLYIEIDF